LADAKELYTSAEVQANTTIKQEEDHIVHARAIDEQERAVEELEKRLQERKG
jgi:hypothetical protein